MIHDPDRPTVEPPVQPPSPDAARLAILFVQSIKGAPASVLLALAFAGRFLSHQELQVWTRCGPAQVTQATRSLVTVGWVVSRTSRGPWALAPGRQLPVLFSFSGANDFKSLNDDDDSIKPINEESTSSNDHRNHLRAVLDEHGIEEPTATELAELPHVSEDYVRAHVQAARARGLTLGVAIQRMRMGVPPPVAAVPRSRQAAVEDKIRRFVEGG